MKNYDDIEIYHDDGDDGDIINSLFAYREYYIGRLIMREGVYIDPFPAEEDTFLDGLEGGGLGYE